MVFNNFLRVFVFFFFFQAEDGIRDRLVTGVQTCALPISVPGIAISTTSTSTPEDTFALPPKLLAVSDIEGNLNHLIEFLQFHNVIDKEFNWS